jgi:hypothetical protein
MLVVALTFPLVIFVFGIAPQFMYQTNFALIVGLPLAALGALFLVTFLEQRSLSAIKFKIPGFEFEGASGQIVLWVMCYLAIATSFKMLWTPPDLSGRLAPGGNSQRQSNTTAVPQASAERSTSGTIEPLAQSAESTPGAAR